MNGDKSYEYKGGAIEFKNVKFRNLENFNLSIPAGAKVGICGKSGSGKSTVLRLIARLAAPERGKVLVDGQSLAEIDREDWAQQVGVVSQSTSMFNDSVLFNLRYAKEDATAAELEKVCRGAQIHEMITQLPNGYEHSVGERGSRLSGGELQRLSIARCLLREPRILLFDEATSSQDPETAQKLVKTIMDKGNNRTMLLVAHRLAFLRELCDYMVVIDDGKLAETGTHEELLEKPDGIYRKLWEEDLNFEKR